MGLPQQQSTLPAQPHTENPKEVSQLPPEALDLASKLFEHARQGQTSTLQQYIVAGIPINLTNHKGDTLLMLAAYYGNVDTVTMLIENGADVNVLNDRGQSPMAGAVFKGFDEVVNAMFEGGADPMKGQPNAVDSARMFHRDECLRIFGAENAG